MSEPTRAEPLRLFQGYGIELEYMIVRRDGLQVLPVCDEVLKAVAGSYVSDIEDGPIAWSNEIVLHVIELKTNGPAPSLAGRAEAFQANVRRIDELLAPLGGRLLGTAMHPFMDPATEKRLWPHESSPVYEAYDRIHGCGGHGWANLQSQHVNLPFSGDEEFGRLHAAIRAVLPLLPALAAASPMMDGRLTGLLDSRLEVYRTNQRKTPLAAARVIPERAWTRAEYDERILAPLYAQIAPYDPEGTLRHEFLNSRGAIARFDRDAIEIRVLDVQECPVADLGIALLVSETVRALAEERWAALEALQALDVEPLADLFIGSIRDAERTTVSDAALLAVLGLPATPTPAAEVWRHLAAEVLSDADAGVAAPRAAVEAILEHGTLARRMSTALGQEPGHARVMAVYGELADCLHDGRMFRV